MPLLGWLVVAGALASAAAAARAGRDRPGVRGAVRAGGRSPRLMVRYSSVSSGPGGTPSSPASAWRADR
ncbi:hypothetical protein [Micromonospora sp. IBSANI012]|uniref:hypothetical protein n=1 Tax=Micromonospora sp. IBSANI012 TaxID=3457761 RepID=UPI00405A2EA8